MTWPIPTPAQLSYTLFELGICGCMGNEVLSLLARTLELCEVDSWDKLREFNGGWDDPRNYLALALLDRYGLLEHGSGIRCSWRTQKGDALLEGLRAHGTDMDEWGDGCEPWEQVK